MRFPSTKWRAVWNSRRLRYTLLVAVITWIFWRQDLAALGQILGRLNPWIGVVMIALNIILLVLFALRWRKIAGALGIVAPWRQFLRATWFSAAVGEVGPPLVLGEWVRFRQLRTFGESWPLVASQVADRLSGQITLLLLVLVLAPGWLPRFANQPTAFLAAIAGLYVVLIAVTGITARRLRMQPGAENLAKNLLGLLLSPGHYSCSLLIQLMLSINVLLSAVALDVARDPVALLLLAPLLLLGASGLPSLVSDWGKREAAALLVLAPAGLRTEEALAVSLLYGLSHLLATLPGWLIGLNRR